jgi:hypothetical protein
MLAQLLGIGRLCDGLPCSGMIFIPDFAEIEGLENY